MAQWIVLAAHGQWYVCSNPIRVIGRAMKGIGPQLLQICPKTRPEFLLTIFWGFPRIFRKTDDLPNLGNI